MPNEALFGDRFIVPPQLKRLIGLGHRARTGKDSVADYLVRHYGYTKLPFAKALKDVCRVLFHFDARQLNGRAKDDVDAYWGVTPRDVMQRLGTDAIRMHFDPDVWVRSLHHTLLIQGYAKVVIPDVRMRNEADYVVAVGGTLVRCVCHDGPSIGAKEAVHATELELDDYDWPHTIEAPFGDLVPLYRAIDKLKP